MTVCGPTEFVTSEPQLDEIRPERVSAAPEVTVAMPLSKTGFGFTTGFKVGAVLSILTVTTLLGALVLPAASVTVCAVEETAVPSALKIWSAGQAPTGIPEPFPSSHVKWTVTLVLYQPAAFGDVVTTATIVGGVESDPIVTVTCWQSLS